MKQLIRYRLLHAALPLRPLTLVALVAAVAWLAVSTGCASTAREASRGSTEGALEGLRGDPVFERLHADVGRDPTVAGIGRRLTDGVVTSVAVSLPSIEQVIDRVADRIVLAARRHTAGMDPLATFDRVVRALARDGMARAEAIIADATERARAAPVHQWAEELGASFARGAMREVTAAVSKEVSRGVDAAVTRALASVTLTPEALDRFHAEIEAISMHMSRGTYKEIQNQVKSDRTWPWVVGIGASVLALLLALRAHREVMMLRRASETSGSSRSP